MRDKRKHISIILACALAASLLAGCVDDSDYRKTLESGQKKYYSGQSMTKEEYNAVKNFNKWKSNQGTKTYSGWGG